MTAQVNTVLVVGATGQTGRVVVATALEHRPPGAGPGPRRGPSPRLLPGADVVGGDLTDAATLTTAVEGVDAVIFTHGADRRPRRLRTRRLRRVVNVLRALGVRRPRIALMTSINVTTTVNRPLRGPDELETTLTSDWCGPAERPTRSSGPAGSTPPEPGDNQLVLAQGDTGTG